MTPSHAATFWLIFWPLLLGALAAGSVLAIKITRRRQAVMDHRYNWVVPADPLSRRDARRMGRSYFYVLGGIILFGIIAVFLI